VSAILISERDFTEQLRDVAKALGYLRHHHWLAKNSSAGWPDEVLVRPPRCVYAELKSEAGKLSDMQIVWLNALAKCGLECYVWRPSNLDAIIECLRPRFRPQAGPGMWVVE
jgi:VRR-NUC domain-containing protein